MSAKKAQKIGFIGSYHGVLFLFFFLVLFLNWGFVADFLWECASHPVPFVFCISAASLAILIIRAIRAERTRHPQ
ncbi:MAG TPA: hypothetical protein VG941_02430 [Candidatus Paceibacterota bacterium]|nr:hypothetical protein [Candidatus Paceibacterota bacterium]